MRKNSVTSRKANKKDLVYEIFNYIAEWLEEANGSKSPHTVMAYKFAMDLYIKFITENQGVTTNNLTWECFARDKIEKWMKWLIDRGNKTQTVNLRLSQIREFLTYMEGISPSIYGHLLHEAMRIRRLKVLYTEVKGVSDAAVEAVLRAIDTKTDAGARDYTLILFLNETGARLNEAISIRMKEIHTDVKGRITVTVKGKGGYIRTLYLTPVLTRKLTEYMQRFHGTSPDLDSYLFFSKIKGKYVKISARAIQKRLREIALEAHNDCKEVPLDLHPHNYRHAYGTRRIKQGKQLAVVQREMGHRVIQSTMTYIDTRSMIEEAQEAAENDEIKKIEPIWDGSNSLYDMYKSRFMK